jgi:Putative DNA-binding domain
VTVPALIQPSLAPGAFGFAPPPARAATGREADLTVTASSKTAVDAVALLVKRFPVVRRLVGEESFRLMARRYMFSTLARASIRLDYGDTFPQFLRTQGTAVSLEYVADIAELEMVRGKARRSADARPLGLQAVASLRMGQFKELCAVLHPSMFLVSSRFPIVTIWENNRCDGEPRMIERWAAESALVARPHLEVEVRRLPRGGRAFIGALSRGQTMSSAVESGRIVTPDFDLDANLMLLLDANIVIEFSEPKRTIDSSRERRIAS